MILYNLSLRPRNNIPGDNRRFLSFWGDEGSMDGGCCRNSSNGLDPDGVWGQEFDLFMVLSNETAGAYFR